LRPMGEAQGRAGLIRGFNFLLNLFVFAWDNR
jgi:hypothetical protein